MPREKIVVMGSINVDLVIHGERLPQPGETVLGGRFSRFSGGKGANQAVAAARASLGPVAFVGAIGEDAFGVEALAGLAAEDIDVRHVRTSPGEASGVALIMVDRTGENAICVAAGANATLSSADVDALPESLFAETAVFLASLEAPLDAIARGLERAKQAGCKTILNPAPADRAIVEREILALVDVLTPNETEAALLAHGLGSGAPSGMVAARRLQQCGPAAVILTLGKRGCLVVAEGAPVEIAPPIVEAVDATAAGDCFNGVLAAALAEGRSIDEAARLATRAAAISVTRRGAQASMPKREEIESLFSEAGD